MSARKNSMKSLQIATNIIKQAKLLGVSLAGIVSLASLRSSPSYKVTNTKMPDAKSFLILALAHNEDEPQLDWWGFDRGTKGNQRLHEISEKLIHRLKEYSIVSQCLAYSPENGGIYLKDAAALAGLGIIGKNNLLITKEYGPRIRLSAVSIEKELPSTPKIEFDPCNICDMVCRKVCPQNAFINGIYSNSLCNVQMKRDESVFSNYTEKQQNPYKCIKYCRACELACPI